MRIIAGARKRRTISFPKSKRTRPVTDRAKETIFNILGHLEGFTKALDLFAGSGSLGLEALSRGVKETWFVECDRGACRCIRENLKQLSLTDSGRILQKNAERAILSLSRRNNTFDLIFLDPPHNKGLIKKILRLLDRSDIVPPAGVIVVGRSNKEGLPEDLQTLEHQRNVKMGQSFISFFRKKV